MIHLYSYLNEARGKFLGTVRRNKKFEITVDADNPMRIPDDTIEDMVHRASENIIDALLHDKINALQYKDKGNRFCIVDPKTDINVIGAVNSKFRGNEEDTIKISIIFVTRQANFVDTNNSYKIELS